MHRGTADEAQITENYGVEPEGDKVHNVVYGPCIPRKSREVVYSESLICVRQSVSCGGFTRGLVCFGGMRDDDGSILLNYVVVENSLFAIV